MESTRHWQFRIFASTWLAYASLYLCRKNFSVVMPALRTDEGVGTETLALAISIYSAFYCAGQFTSGLLSDRFGARRVVFGGMMVSAAATSLLGFLPLGSALIALQAINGFAQACGWPGVLKLMAVWFPPAQRGRVMSWWSSHLVVGGFVSTMFATWAATGPVLAAWGWRRAVWAPAILLAAFGMVFWILARDRETAGNRAAVISGIGEVLASPAIRAIAVMYFAVKCARYVFLFWLPTYMTEGLGYRTDEAGYTSGVFEIAGFGGVLAAGFVSDRFFAGRRFPVGAVAMLLLALACLLHPGLAAAGRWGNVLGIALVGTLTFGADSLMSGAGTQDAVRPEVAATAGGVTNTIGSLGQIVSAPLAAILSTRFGWDSVFYALVAISILGALALVTQWRFVADPLKSASAT